MRQLGWNAYFAAVLAVSVFWVGDALIADSGRSQRWWSDLGWTLASGAAGLLCLKTSLRLHGTQRRAWLLYGAACLAWFAGMLIWSYQDLTQGRETPFPGPADIAFLAFAPLFMVGLIYHATTYPSAVFTVRNLADVGLIVCAALIATAIVLVEPLRDQSVSSAYRLTARAYPVLYGSAFLFSVLVLLRRGALQRRGWRVLLLLMASLGIHALADTVYAYALLDGSFRPGHYLNTVWILAFALTGVAALEQLSAQSGRRADHAPLTSQRARKVEAAVITATLGGIGVLSLVQADQADAALWRDVALAFTVLALFVGLREWANARIQERLFHGLQQSEIELSRIMDSLQDMYFRTESSGRLQRCSSSAQQLLGVDAEELMGSEFHALFVDPRVAEHFTALLSQPGAAVENFEARWHRPGGNETWVSISAHRLDAQQPSSLAWEGTARNVTAQRRAEAQMYQLSSALEQTADAVMITDRNGNIEYVNPAFTRISGYSRDEALGRKPELVKSGRHGRKFYQQLWQRILAGEVFDDVFVNRRKDGSLYYEAKTITPVTDAHGNVINFISTGKDVTEQMETQEQLRFLAEHDVLTELPNRQVLIERMGQSLARARRRDRLVAVLFMDLDQFKYVNDSLGHDVGDDLLVQMARRLLRRVREGDTVARFGGDEFVLVIDEAESLADITAIAEKLLDSLTPPFMVSGMELHVTASVGISVFPDDGQDSETLLRNADNAMYRAKEAGRNSYRFYSGDMSARAFERLTLENNLRTALERDEFELYYQPQVRVSDREVVGMEALVRWNHPELGLVPPEDFIPLLEDTGLIVPVGEWILRQACMQMRRWRDLGIAHGRMTVNISARQFADRGFVDTVRRTLDTAGLDHDCLELEMTESVFLRDSHDTTETLRTIGELGVALAIDDFGTGYSSLSYLKRFPIDTLKIDRSFIRDITDDPDDEALSGAILAMAQRLQLRVIAEGVETEAQLTMLRELGCELVQGYLFSRPLAAAQMQQYLQQAVRAAGAS